MINNSRIGMYIGNETLLLSSETLLKRILPGVKKIILCCVFPCISRCVPSTEGSITMSISGYIGEIYFPGVKNVLNYDIHDLNFEIHLST